MKKTILLFSVLVMLLSVSVVFLGCGDTPAGDNAGDNSGDSAAYIGNMVLV